MNRLCVFHHYPYYRARFQCIGSNEMWTSLSNALNAYIVHRPHAHSHKMFKKNKRFFVNNKHIHTEWSVCKSSNLDECRTAATLRSKNFEIHQHPELICLCMERKMCEWCHEICVFSFILCVSDSFELIIKRDLVLPKTDLSISSLLISICTTNEWMTQKHCCIFEIHIEWAICATKGLILIYFDMDMQIMPVKLLMLFYTIQMVQRSYGSETN